MADHLLRMRRWHPHSVPAGLDTCLKSWRAATCSCRQHCARHTHGSESTERNSLRSFQSAFLLRTTRTKILRRVPGLSGPCQGLKVSSNPSESCKLRGRGPTFNEMGRRLNPHGHRQVVVGTAPCPKPWRATSENVELDRPTIQPGGKAASYVLIFLLPEN